MARTQTLQEMVSNLRAEAGHSTSVAQGGNTEATLKYLLKRTQEELWTAFVWPELMQRDDRPMTPGIFLYNYSTNLRFDAIREAYAAAADASNWVSVGYGIGEDKIVPVSNANTTDSDPVQLWEAAGTQFRVWPTPTAAATLRFKGNRELNPLISNSRFFDPGRHRHHPVRRIGTAGPIESRGRRQQAPEGTAAPDQAARQPGQRQEQGQHLRHLRTQRRPRPYRNRRRISMSHGL